MSVQNVEPASGLETPDVILTLADFAAREKVSVQTVRLWRMNGNDPVSFKAGRHVRYRLSDVEAWECEQIAKAAA